MKLIDYLRSNRRGPLANQLERKALDDPFMQDALDGLDAVMGNHLSVIEGLEKKVLAATTKKKAMYRRWITGVAASVALVVGLGLLIYRLPVASNSPQIATVQPISKPSVAKTALAKNCPVSKSVPLEFAQEQLPHKKNESTTIASQPDELSMPQIPSKEMAKSEEPSKIAENMQADNAVPIAYDQSHPITSSAPSAAAQSSVPITRTESRRVIGKILDAYSGKEIVGATIVVEGSKKTSTSDLDGNFSVDVTYLKKPTIVVNVPGYKTQKMQVANKSDITVYLDLDVPMDLANANMDSIRTALTLSNTALAQSSAKSKAMTPTLANGVKRNIYTFGEAEFQKYFERNRKQTICEDREEETDVRFYIDKKGIPTDIYIYNCQCSELELELNKVLDGCPRWSSTRRTVTMHLKINAVK
jgi:CarboxypepD_reg-like domain